MVSESQLERFEERTYIKIRVARQMVNRHMKELTKASQTLDDVDPHWK
jgi:hypothetical protein